MGLLEKGEELVKPKNKKNKVVSKPKKQKVIQKKTTKTKKIIQKEKASPKIESPILSETNFNFEHTSSNIKIETNLDKIYSDIKEKKIKTIPQMAFKFGMDVHTAESWARILDNQGLIKLIYPLFGPPQIKPIEGDCNKKKMHWIVKFFLWLITLGLILFLALSLVVLVY
jgi:hypothetical protein